MMTALIPEETIEEIRRSLNIVNVVSEYVVLKRTGRNYVGLCPFHQEKTPSFMVSHEKQIYHCFGCGQGGNVISFLMEIEKTTFPEAVKILAEKAGIRLPEKTLSFAGQEQTKEKDILFKVVKLAAAYYEYVLFNSSAGMQALNYLKSRNIKEETARRFKLGFAPDSWEALLKFMKKRDITEEILLKAGLVTLNSDKNGYYDRFRKRLIFPIADRKGRIVGFGGRVLGASEPKYLNSPQTYIFDKSRLLYGLHLAGNAIRKEGYALVFEGYMDVITAAQAGIKNAVASMGTALSFEQARQLRLLGKDVVISYDPDTAGQVATLRGLKILKKAGCNVKVAELPEGMDPDAYIKNKGPENFKKEIIGASLPLVEYQLKKIKENYNLQKAQDKASFLRDSLEVLSEIEDILERESYTRKIEEELELTGGALRQELKKARRRKIATDNTNNLAEKGKNRSISAGFFIDPGEVAERKLISLVLANPLLLGYLKGKLKGEDFNNSVYGALFSELLYLFENGKHIDIGAFINSKRDNKVQSLLAELYFEEEEEEELQKKIVEDCIKKIFITNIGNKKKNIEAQMQEIESKKENQEINSLLQEWQRLRKLEDLFRFGEGRD
ncbi:MAG TPA: DNA primase [Firmicutes bacterium]|nr:DNA primase [Bacillota bacterium]